jgi:hypothetical protein
MQICLSSSVICLSSDLSNLVFQQFHTRERKKYERAFGAFGRFPFGASRCRDTRVKFLFRLDFQHNKMGIIEKCASSLVAFVLFSKLTDAVQLGVTTAFRCFLQDKGDRVRDEQDSKEQGVTFYSLFIALR